MRLLVLEDARTRSDRAPRAELDVATHGPGTRMTPAVDHSTSGGSSDSLIRPFRRRRSARAITRILTGVRQHAEAGRAPADESTTRAIPSAA